MELLGTGTSLQGVVGNGRMTACMLPNGTLSALFWPHAGYPQHLKEASTGVFVTGPGDRGGEFVWLDEKSWTVGQRYLAHSNVVETTYEGWGGLLVSKTAFVDHELDVLVCTHRVAGVSDGGARGVRLLQYQNPEMGETRWGDAVFYDQRHDGVLHHYLDTYLAFCSDEQSSSFQCGITDGEGDARADCEDGSLGRTTAALYRGRLGVNSALAYDLGTVGRGISRRLDYFVTAGPTLDLTISAMETARSIGARKLLARTAGHWASSVRRRVPPNLRGPVARLVERSVLVLQLACDRETGGIIACPSIDPDYRYVWPRDGFYAALALDRTGHHAEAARFYSWCTRAQDRTGVLHQRYFAKPEHVGPSWGPSWGEETDETSAVMWGVVEHFRLTRDMGFLSHMWPFMRRATEYLVGTVNEASGRMEPTMDLWEEGSSRHIYSVITAVAGIRAAAVAAKRLRFEDETLEWETLSRSLERHLLGDYWSGELGHFIRNAAPRDEQPDISSLALSYPFGILPDDDLRMVRTADALAGAFEFKAGGVGRFPSDSNYGGNPWIISACWLALHYSRVGDLRKARSMLNWCAEHATGLGLLPEQAEKDTGKPLSAIPLSWSHAMLILAAQEASSARR